MTSARNSFRTLLEGAFFSVPMNDKPTADVAGYGSVKIGLDKNEKYVECVVGYDLFVTSP